MSLTKIKQLTWPSEIVLIPEHFKTHNMQVQDSKTSWQSIDRCLLFSSFTRSYLEKNIISTQSTTDISEWFLHLRHYSNDFACLFSPNTSYSPLKKKQLLSLAQMRKISSSLRCLSWSTNSKKKSKPQPPKRKKSWIKFTSPFYVVWVKMFIF